MSQESISDPSLRTDLFLVLFLSLSLVFDCSKCFGSRFTGCTITVETILFDCVEIKRTFLNEYVGEEGVTVRGDSLVGTFAVAQSLSRLNSLYILPFVSFYLFSQGCIYTSGGPRCNIMRPDKSGPAFDASKCMKFCTGLPIITERTFEFAVCFISPSN